MSLIKKIYKGAFWNVASQFGAQGINFVILILLARTLAPQDFGLVGMAAVVTSFFSYFSDLGLAGCLIQNKDADEADCNTVFWSAILFSLVIYTIGFFLSPLIARFYGDERLVLISRVLFAEFLIAPIALVSGTLEVKNLHYQKQTQANLISLLVSGILGVVLAYRGFGVWSLIAQQVSMTALYTATLFITCGWRPKWIFSMKKLIPMMRLGSQYTLRHGIQYFSDSIDFLVVGKLLGPAAVGIYGLALRIARYPITKLWSILGDMLFPAFASIQDDLGRVKKNFIKITVCGGLALVPPLVCIFFGIRPFIVLFLGESWLPAVPVVQCFTAGLLFDSIFMADEALLLTFAKLRSVNLIRSATCGVLLIAGYFATRRWGTVGMAVVFSVVAILNVFLVKWVVIRHLDIKASDYWKKTKVIAGPCVLIFALVGVYAWIARPLLAPAVFLVGEAVIAGLFYLWLTRKYRLVDWAGKKINFDHLIAS